MVVITISYPHQPRFNYNSFASSNSVSPTLTDSSGGSERLPSLLQISADGDTLAATKQGKQNVTLVNFTTYSLYA